MSSWVEFLRQATYNIVSPADFWEVLTTEAVTTAAREPGLQLLSGPREQRPDDHLPLGSGRQCPGLGWGPVLGGRRLQRPLFAFGLSGHLPRGQRSEPAPVRAAVQGWLPVCPARRSPGCSSHGRAGVSAPREHRCRASRCSNTNLKYPGPTCVSPSGHHCSQEYFNQDGRRWAVTTPSQGLGRKAHPTPLLSPCASPRLG